MSGPQPSRGRIALKAVVYGLSLLTLCVALALAHVVMKPFPRKFFCDDQSLKYPIGECTVPYYVCAPIGILAACLTVAAAEWGHAAAAAAAAAAAGTRGTPNKGHLMAFSRSVFSSEFRALYFSQTLYGVYYFCLGLAACDLVMGLTKNWFGRHRPFFYTACRPELPWGHGGCNASLPLDVAVCRPAVSARDFADAQRSFPSGHASFSVYCAAFICLYLHRRGRGGSGARRLPTIPRLACQFAAALGGLYVACSRVWDYKHHWSDILAGGLLGTALACAAASAVPASGGGYRDRPPVDREGDQDRPAVV